MSYILEALKKSEQERNPEKVPDLATHHRQISHQEKSKLPYWIFGIALVVINGLVLLYLIEPKPIPKTVSSEPQTEKANVESKPDISEPAAETYSGKIEQLPIVDNKPSSIADERLPVIVEDAPIEVAAIMEAQVVDTPAIKDNSLDRAAIPDISELSYNIQQQIPDMDFSTHIYVGDGGSFIIINGRSLSEGMNVQSGLRVLQILSDGIILEFKGRRFFLASMTNWQQD